MKNTDQRIDPDPSPIAKIIRNVYQDQVSIESTCLMSSKFKPEVKDKLSCSLKD